jgi:hypothetical protein
MWKIVKRKHSKSVDKAQGFSSDPVAQIYLIWKTTPYHTLTFCLSAKVMTDEPSLLIID